MRGEKVSRGIILDMDGVITDTRELHFLSWKKTFFDFFKERKVEATSFGLKDYQVYVDGKSRSEGIISFLSSHSIKLTPEELEELGSTKNRYFLNLLETHELKVFPDSLESIRAWKAQNVPLAVISASKNGKSILQKGGILHLFDVCIDGVEGEKLALKGKPYPDFFLKAARMLDKNPSECVIVEDSLAGIAAGVKGHFMDVIGVSRAGQTPARDLYAEGADRVVSSLTEIDSLPNAITSWNDLEARIGVRDIALFLDFDGTLSPIVSHHTAAVIDPVIKETLTLLSKSIKTAIISGRDLSDLKERVQIEELFYVGCHGLDMSGPGCFHYAVEEVKEVLPMLKQAGDLLMSEFAEEEGVSFEKKKYSMAIHYRNKIDLNWPVFKEKIFHVIEKFPRLKLKEGKKVVEIYPDVGWGKGEAIKKLCEILNINLSDTVPLYIGDDLTDEDAFNALRRMGVGIKIEEVERLSTKAIYWLKDISEVRIFLDRLAGQYSGSEKRWRVGS